MKLRRITKWFQKRSTLHMKIPSTTTIGYVFLIIGIFVISGGIYDILERPPAFLPSSDGTTLLFYYPGINAQTSTEGIQSFFLFAIGTIGGTLVLRSTRYTYKPRESAIILTLGLVMILVGYLGCLSVLTTKAPAIWT